MLTALRLVVALNHVDARLVSAAEAEHALTGGSRLHSVDDPDDLLPGTGGSLRLALGRVAHQPLGQGWILALPAPGRPGPLRGPKEVTRALVANRSSVVLHTRTGLLWEPCETDADGTLAVRWRLRAANRPATAPLPHEAAQALGRTIGEATTTLEALGLTAGALAERAGTVRLGGAYPATSQVLLDRALVLLGHIEAALEAAPEVLHSHGVLTREQVLRRLEAACLDAIEAAASWPTHLMQ
ncbi:hypothetical protein [Aestuariimicrobium ganziense]|uniref:hypothetical protein n=1 Tax=Aestuariimicrobium ganziense TaxID=2773677 RepID=UPI001941B286|nr:hypothetical protein [Aestuariimicrobium ganziense]